MQPDTWHVLVEELYTALIKDCEQRVPAVNRKALSHDLLMLRSHCVNRGLPFFTIDLPAAGKALEASLETGSLNVDVPGFGRARYKRCYDHRPRLFWALWSRVFTRHGRLKEDPCVDSIFLLRQLCYLFKKWEKNCSDTALHQTTQEFFATENLLPSPDFDWDGGSSDFSRAARTISVQQYPGEVAIQYGAIVQQVFDLLANDLPILDVFSVYGRHGPGAVSNLGNYSKFAFPFWSDKLEHVFPFDWFGSTSLLVDDPIPLNVEFPSRLIAVPKTQKGPRLIAAEPLENQWIQQGLLSWFVSAFAKSKVLRRLRFHDQGQNQRAAKAASLGSLATLDLSSASDRLSCYLVERVFRTRPDILQAIIACRTSRLYNGIDRRYPATVELRKFASMGSALTFPIQSFVFFGLALASSLVGRGLKPSYGNLRLVGKDVCVYGDDIIVPADIAAVCVSFIEAHDLKVNRGKSFWTGKFRESCGRDYYDGVDVTPAYVRRDLDLKRPSTISSVVEASNNLHKAGCWNAAATLQERVPARIAEMLFIGRNNGDGPAGLYSFCGGKADHLKTRWNSDLQRQEHKVAILLTEDSATVETRGRTRLRHFFRSPPVPFVKWTSWETRSTRPVFRTRYVALAT